MTGPLSGVTVVAMEQARLGYGPVWDGLAAADHDPDETVVDTLGP